MRSITDIMMAYPSLFADKDDNGVNRAQLQQERILEEANCKFREREASRPSGLRTLSVDGQPLISIDRHRGYSKIVGERRRRRKELAIKHRVNWASHRWCQEE